MKKSILFFVCFLTACAGRPIYQDPPQTILRSEEMVRTQGVFRDMGFVALSKYENEQTRVIVMSEIGIKLADMTVFPSKTDIYFKQAQFPLRAVEAFARFTRAHLFAVCPPAQVEYKDRFSRAVFKAQSKGEQCP